MSNLFRKVALAISLWGASAIFGVSGRSLGVQDLAEQYRPMTQVADQESIDLDQDSIEKQLAQGEFKLAKAIYERGGHTQSFAEISLSEPLSGNVKRGTHITGKNGNNAEIFGKAFRHAEEGDRVMWVEYRSDSRELHEPCYVGALPLVGDEELNGCFSENGTITVDTVGPVDYSYNMLEHNANGITIAGFSKHAHKIMRKCSDCPYYEDYAQFYDYYGIFDYAHQWVTAALDGGRTPGTVSNGQAFFSLLSDDNRAEACRRGMVCLNVFMGVLHKFENATDDCTGCDSADENCNYDAVRSWDEGVAYYTGSLESEGENEGNLLHALADEMCQKFKTCGKEGNSLEGTSKLNGDIFELFSQGQGQLLDGKCNDARATKDRIAELMYVPIIQGALNSVYSVEKLHDHDKSLGSGAAFAAAILPKLHHCSVDAANMVYETMRVGATYSSTSFARVKASFEANYECMGISCSDVGGLFNMPETSYYEGASGCIDTDVKEESELDLLESKALDNIAGIIAGSVVGLAAGLIVAFLVLPVLRQRRSISITYSSAADTDIDDYSPDGEGGKTVDVLL